MVAASSSQGLAWPLKNVQRFEPVEVVVVVPAVPGEQGPVDQGDQVGAAAGVAGVDVQQSAAAVEHDLADAAQQRVDRSVSTSMCGSGVVVMAGSAERAERAVS